MSDMSDGFGGSGIFFAFLIFALFAFGGNANAFGGWGGRGIGGAGAVIADNNITSQLDNIQAQNFYNNLNSGIAGLQSTLCQGFAGVNQTINNTAAAAALQTSNQTRDIIAAITAGNAALSTKIDQNTISALQTENARLYADKSNLLQSMGFGDKICGLEKQLAACCCKTQNDLDLILSKLPTSTTTGSTAA